MRFYQPLKLNPNCFSKERLMSEVENEFEDRTITQTWKKWGQHSDIFDAEFNSILGIRSCSIAFAELFYTPPGGRLRWHIDTEKPSNYIKLNFVWGSQKHVMMWGESNSRKILRYKLTMSGTKYLDFQDNEITVLEQTTIVHPTIVNIGSPHSVINLDSIPRWCLSVNIHQEGNRIPFNKAVRIFSEYALDSEEPC
jgi:hypothetical protein